MTTETETGLALKRLMLAANFIKQAGNPSFPFGAKEYGFFYNALKSTGVDPAAYLKAELKSRADGFANNKQLAMGFLDSPVTIDQNPKTSPVDINGNGAGLINLAVAAYKAALVAAGKPTEEWEKQITAARGGITDHLESQKEILTDQFIWRVGAHPEVPFTTADCDKLFEDFKNLGVQNPQGHLRHALEGQIRLFKNSPKVADTYMNNGPKFEMPEVSEAERKEFLAKRCASPRLPELQQHLVDLAKEAYETAAARTGRGEGIKI